MVYMEAAKKYHNKELAINKAQLALHHAVDSMKENKINEIKKFLKEIIQDRDQNQNDDYINFLFEEKECIVSE